MTIAEAVTGPSGDAQCSNIIFCPVLELPSSLQRELQPFLGAFPGNVSEETKYTMCVANEGFGIGFHRHSAAIFMLVEGRKKWYMGPQSTEHNTPTHPGFYREKSTHKCIQVAGEALYVPNQWYHEIFNLEYTAGVQALG